MAKDKDAAQEQNISEVLEMLKRSYSENSENDIFDDSPITQDKNDVISDEDLKKQLRMQYSAQEDEYSQTAEDTYQIDDVFLAEADANNAEAEEPDEELEEEPEEEPEEEHEEEPEEELEEEPEEEPEEELEEAREIEYLAQLDEDDDAPLTAEEIEMLRRFSEDEMVREEEEAIEEDITFDQLPLSDKVEDIQLETIPLETISEEVDDDITFDELAVATETREKDDIVYTPLALEEDGVDEDNDDVPWEENSDAELSEDEATAKEPAYEMLTVYDTVSSVVNDDSTDPVGIEETENEVIEELLGEFSDEQEEKPKYKVTDAELSLLLQLGCDEEIFELASEEDIDDISLNESIDSIPSVQASLSEDNDARQKETEERLKEKILSVYEEKRKARGGILVRMMVTAILCGVLLIYDGLPLLGVHLPGIMDRKEFFLSYVLIGLQLLVIALVPSVKQLWSGAKKLFTCRPDSYSMIILLFAVVLIYDCMIATVKIGTPYVFHFVLAFLAFAVTAAECADITYEIATYRFFFEDIIDGNATKKAEEARKSTFTLRRSEGKNSLAEKMYRGGLDTSQTIYYPTSIELATEYFNSESKSYAKQYSVTLMILPSAVVSVLAGILSLVLPSFEGEAYAAVDVMLTTLFMTAPITALLSVWLPFRAFNARNIRSGFAFASESSASEYSDCNMFVFEDMHVFEKCSPKSVNIAIYDATPKDILVSCLNSLYSTIGGPLSDSFSMGNTQSLGECRLKRVAKSGVEAVIGNNYSVLVGNEQFMSRYGISFPQISFKNKNDEIFSLCVSINGRASGRIIVKYVVNEMFEMLAWRLKEDGIYCVLESFDPMISTELLARLRDKELPPISVVRLGVEDITRVSLRRKEDVLSGVKENCSGLIARRSRLNLVVAAINAKRTVNMRRRVNLVCYALGAVGAAVSMASLFLNWNAGINEFYLLLFWLICGGAVAATVFFSLPRTDRFTLEAYRADLEQETDKSKNQR